MVYCGNTHKSLFQSIPVHDAVRECLEKDPTERTDDDIEVLLEAMQHMPVRVSTGAKQHTVHMYV